MHDATRDHPAHLLEELPLAQECERAERYRSVYTSLGLRVIAHKDGTLELTWRIGKGVSEVCASPRCTASATTSSSSTPARSRGRTCPTSRGRRATGTSASERTGYSCRPPRIPQT